MAEGWLEGEGLVEDGWKIAVGWPECREQSCSFVPEQGGAGTRKCVRCLLHGKTVFSIIQY